MNKVLDTNVKVKRVRPNKLRGHVAIRPSLKVPKVPIDNIYVKYNSLDIYDNQYLKDKIQAKGYRAVLIDDVCSIVDDNIRDMLIRRVANINNITAKTLIDKAMKRNYQTKVVMRKQAQKQIQKKVDLKGVFY